MKSKQLVGRVITVSCLILFAALPARPANAAPAPEETAFYSTWFPETLSTGR